VEEAWSAKRESRTVDYKRKRREVGFYLLVYLVFASHGCMLGPKDEQDEDA
jgi:hypothetical protein